jgi:hypothetical protein
MLVFDFETSIKPASEETALYISAVKPSDDDFVIWV